MRYSLDSICTYHSALPSTITSEALSSFNSHSFVQCECKSASSVTNHIIRAYNISLRRRRRILKNMQIEYILFSRFKIKGISTLNILPVIHCSQRRDESAKSGKSIIQLRRWVSCASCEYTHSSTVCSSNDSVSTSLILTWISHPPPILFTSKHSRESGRGFLLQVIFFSKKSFNQASTLLRASSALCTTYDFNTCAQFLQNGGHICCHSTYRRIRHAPPHLIRPAVRCGAVAAGEAARRAHLHFVRGRWVHGHAAAREILLEL